MVFRLSGTCARSVRSDRSVTAGAVLSMELFGPAGTASPSVWLRGRTFALSAEERFFAIR